MFSPLRGCRPRRRIEARLQIPPPQPPDIVFMSCMPLDGLIEMPPESKVMPFPTTHTVGRFRAPRRGACSSTTSRGGWMLP
jgi:hypothetical protein